MRYVCRGNFISPAPIKRFIHRYLRRASPLGCDSSRAATAMVPSSRSNFFVNATKVHYRRLKTADFASKTSQYRAIKRLSSINTNYF
jgi:hypothetical protein